jgi:hypothetical protein
MGRLLEEPPWTSTADHLMRLSDGAVQPSVSGTNEKKKGRLSEARLLT